MRILRKLLNIRVIVIIGIVVMAILFSHTLQKKKNAATSTESARDGGKSNVASTSPSKESETFDAEHINEAETSTESARDGGKSNVASTSPSKESETFDAAPVNEAEQ